jgi:hypothetical protein
MTKDGDGLLPLAAAEEKLVAAARAGQVCDVSADPDDERRVRAEVVAALVLGLRKDWACASWGVHLDGSLVEGELDLRSATLPVPLRLTGCTFDSAIQLGDARLWTLDLSDSTIPYLDAPGMKIDGDLGLSAVTSSAGVQLAALRINGSVYGSGAKLTSDSGPALDLGAARIEGSLLLGLLEATGPVVLSGAQIEKTVDLSGASIENEGGNAFEGDSLEIGGAAFFRAFHAKGTVNLYGLTTGQSLDMSGASLEHDGPALVLTAAEIGGAAGFASWTDGDEVAPFRAKGTVDLTGAHVGQTVAFLGAQLEYPKGDALMADSLDAKGALLLRAGFKAHGTVNLVGAHVGQSADFSAAEFEAGDAGFALVATSAVIDGPLLLNANPEPFRARGKVYLASVTVGQGVSFAGADIEGPEPAVVADTIKVARGLFMGSGFDARGGVSLVGADITGALDLRGGRVSATNVFALSASTASISGGIVAYPLYDEGGAAERFRADGGVDLTMVTAASVDMGGAAIGRAGEVALSLTSAQIRGDVSLAGVFSRTDPPELLPFEAEGTVYMRGASVGGTLNLAGARIAGADGLALMADSIDVAGGAFLRNGFSAEGMVNILGADIGQSLDLSSAQLHGGPDGALVAESIDVTGPMYLSGGFDLEGEPRPFVARGPVNLMGAAIGQTLFIQAARLEPPGAASAPEPPPVEQPAAPVPAPSEAGDVPPQPPAPPVEPPPLPPPDFPMPRYVALTLEGAKIQGDLILRQLLATGGPALQGDVVLARARTTRLLDDESAWPPPEFALDLDGFEYEVLDADAPAGVQTRLRWLALQEPGQEPRPWWSAGGGHVLTRPYEQLAIVYDRVGDERSAREIRIARERRVRDYGTMRRRSRMWSHFLDHTVLYGYAAWRSLFAGILMIALGTVIFWSAFQDGVMRTGDPAKAPQFQPFVYSFDAFAPIIDLDQQDAWSPDAAAPWTPFGLDLSGRWVQWYLWFHIALGWIVTTLAVAALSGLVRRT